MRRSPMPARKAPMNPGKGLARGPLERAGGLDRAGPLPAKRGAPRRRSREHVCCGEAEGKARVRERTGGTREVYGLCEICGACRATQFSHRVAEGRGGCWCPSNGLGVCGFGNVTGPPGEPGFCHGRVHANRDGEAYANGWAVATGVNPAGVSVTLARWGRVLLLADGGIVLPA